MSSNGSAWHVKPLRKYDLEWEQFYKMSETPLCKPLLGPETDKVLPYITGGPREHSYVSLECNDEKC